jgi:hypothetical protein
MKVDLSSADDHVQREPGGPSQAGVVPHLRIGNRWFNTVWLVPLGVDGRGDRSEHHHKAMTFDLRILRIGITPISLIVAICSLADICLASEEMDELRGQLAKQQTEIRQQQQQIDELRRILGEQARLLATMQVKPTSEGPPKTKSAYAELDLSVPQTQTSQPTQTSQATAQPIEANARSPLSVGVGPLTIAPTGFLEYSQVWRSRNVDSGEPTNYAAIPFGDTVDGHRTQTLSSAANTRLGVQVNGNFSALRLLGVVETDFIGFQPGNISTTSNSYGMRMRLAFADIQAGKWEFLGGQNWSMLTPGRKGISPSAADLFLTQAVDPNIHSGLVWTRSPQFRSVYRPKPRIALGISFESGQAYGGGSAGAGTITLPSAFAPDYSGQVELGTGALSVPNSHLDIVGKVAVDSGNTEHPIHLEIAGVTNEFSFYNPLTGKHFSSRGGGASLNVSAGLAKGLTLLTANYYSDGGGRFIFGEAPSLIIQGNGAPSLIHSMSTLNGVEFQATPNWKFWGYYGGTYIGKNVAIDPANGQLIGYGYSGSPDNDNRSIQEVTGGFTRAHALKANYGTLQFIGQYSWVVRHPWYLAPTRPTDAHISMLFLTFRYVLPAAGAP